MMQLPAMPLPAMQLPAPMLEPFCSLDVQVGPAVSMGTSASGLRRVVPIVGGTVRGQGDYAAFTGGVMSGGNDYQLHQTEPGQSTPTIAHLDARYTLTLLDGSLIYVHNTALRVASAAVCAQLMRGEVVDSNLVYFRCAPRFEAGAAQWAWLMRHQFVGTGARLPSAVHLSFFIVR